MQSFGLGLCSNHTYIPPKVETSDVVLKFFYGVESAQAVMVNMCLKIFVVRKRPEMHDGPHLCRQLTPSSSTISPPFSNF
ncbi:hypothetical protein T11_8784 [Trichinella zimbabwensis]|uniref:Uncharacterized protein n=1 Tax=Trichinella zimbabwensis TaxID=268475 RepID=A0A0V1GRW5_9BILA|nr:hypothetical protein T11_1246 [Trichinella zimbabwensis]KRZ01261.1 hypothetical protein T11_8784 [Trichinella zimbabwensis]